jgi:hypothetical protein
LVCKPEKSEIGTVWYFNVSGQFHRIALFLPEHNGMKLSLLQKILFMKISAYSLMVILSLATLAVLFIASSAIQIDSKNSQLSPVINQMQKAETGQKIVYTCPMHAGVTSEKPGKCSKCGINLVKRETPVHSYFCSRHIGVSQDKPGKCPFCDRDLVKK